MPEDPAMPMIEQYEHPEPREKIGPIIRDPISAGSGKGIKVRLTLGPVVIDLEGTLEEIVQVVTRLTQEFTDKKIIALNR